VLKKGSKKKFKKKVQKRSNRPKKDFLGNPGLSLAEKFKQKIHHYIAKKRVLNIPKFLLL